MSQFRGAPSFTAGVIAVAALMCRRCLIRVIKASFELIAALSVVLNPLALSWVELGHLQGRHQ